MSPKERRAYRFGYLCAMRKARRQLGELGRRLDDEIAGLRKDALRADHVAEAVNQLGD